MTTVQQHCWHKTGMGGGHSSSAEICCYCGMVHDPEKRITPEGHGKFVPYGDMVYPKRSEACPVRR